jgi:hypothetical protein
MDWIRRIVVSKTEPEDKDVLWIDSSDHTIHIIKIYDKGVWKPLVADKVVSQVPSYLNGYYINGTNGFVEINPGCSVATINLDKAKRIWFLAETARSNSANVGYAFYDKDGNALEYHCFQSDENLTESKTVEFEQIVPVNAVKFRTTLYDKVTQENFYCNTGKVYVDSVSIGGVGTKCNTTEYWNNAIGFKPSAGEIIIYSDYKKIEKDGQLVDVPGIKIGSGNAYIQDLAFLDEYDADILVKHVMNNNIHITQQERQKWNGKLNIDDSTEVINEMLILNRD